MTLTLMSNLLTIILCIGVIVQGSRMMVRLRAVSDGQMGNIVSGLDRATAQASLVLADLKQTLAVEGGALAQSLVQAEELRDELSVLIGIANAMAERLVEAGQTPRPACDAELAP